MFLIRPELCVVFTEHGYDDISSSYSCNRHNNNISVLDEERSENLFIPESNAHQIVEHLSNEWDLGR